MIDFGAGERRFTLCKRILLLSLAFVLIAAGFPYSWRYGGRHREERIGDATIFFGYEVFACLVLAFFASACAGILAATRRQRLSFYQREAASQAALCESEERLRLALSTGKRWRTPSGTISPERRRTSASSLAEKEVPLSEIRHRFYDSSGMASIDFALDPRQAADGLRGDFPDFRGFLVVGMPLFRVLIASTQGGPHGGREKIRHPSR